MSDAFQRKSRGLSDNGYLLWGLIAVELLMSFSFMGYIHIEPISITFVYIPVLAAGCILGIKEASLVGAVFGIASLWKASAFYVGTGDSIFSPALSGKPIESILLSVGARMLFGLTIGILYYLAKKGRHPFAGILVVTTLGRSIHTFLVYLFIQIFFPETGFTVANTIKDILRWDYVPFLVFADIVVGALYLFSRSAYVKNLFEHVRFVDHVNSFTAHYKRWLAVMLMAVLVCSFSVAFYFTNRIRAVLAEYGLDLKEEASYDLMHLQIQFLFGMIAIALIVIIVIILYQKNFNYLYYEARMDGLTGIFGRQQFFQTGNQRLLEMKHDRNGKSGYFIILDIDEFKRINDIYGHPAGDDVLVNVAEELREIFENKGIPGRLGGDEFVILVDQEMTREEIESHLIGLRDRVRKIRVGDMRVTCSIGVIPAENRYTLDELYKHADSLLYEAKKKGKDQFVFGDGTEVTERKMPKEKGGECAAGEDKG